MRTTGRTGRKTKKRLTFADADDAPEAYRVQWFKCEECDNLHLAMVDEDLNFIGIANIPRETIVMMLASIDGPPEGSLH